MSKVLRKPLGDGVVELQLHDPENDNLLGEELCGDLISALSQISEEPDLKVLLLTGDSKSFCAGASLDGLKKLCAKTISYPPLTLPPQLIGYPVPVIAALEGHAVGGGLVLAISCDMTVAASEKRFGFNFTTMGFTPGLGTTRLLPALVGHCFASEMLLTGKLYKGAELQGRGLFNAVVPGRTVRTVAMELAARIAERPKYVIESVKKTLAQTRAQGLQEALSQELILQEWCFKQPGALALIEQYYPK